jgi:hypothetical protein
MSIVLQSTGGGSVTINEPSTASNFTQTLPASDGTIINTGSPQSGSVIQVVNTTVNTNSTTTSTSFVNFNALNTSITPKFSTSKILITATLNLFEGASNSNYQATLYRGGTNLGGSNNYFVYAYGSAVINLSLPTTLIYLDSPATTSSTTYSVYGRTSSGTLNFNNGAGQISMTLMEIAA